MNVKEIKTINIGNIYITEKPMKLTAVLGSCVAICLWDSESGVGGMNHYLLPESEKGSILPDPKTSFRYGSTSIPILIKQILNTSARPEKLVGKIFGGGMNPSLEHQSGIKIAESNIAVAERVLKEAGIKIVERNVGGTEGRKVVFDIKTGQVTVERINIKFFRTNQS